MAAPSLNNFSITTPSDGVIRAACDYADTVDVTRVRLAVCSSAALVPTGVGSGGAETVTDAGALLVYDSDSGDMAAPSGLSGTWTDDLSFFLGGEIHAAIAMRNTSGDWTDWTASVTVRIAGAGAPAYSGASGIQALITNIKARLLSQIPTYYTDCEAIPGLIIPEWVRFPFIGIADGGLRRDYRATDRALEVINIEVYVFTEVLLGAEKGVIGDTNTRGVLELAEIVRAALEDYTFGASEYFDARCESEAAVETFEWSQGRLIQGKGLRFIYDRERGI